jgi:hypothetical protein
MASPAALNTAEVKNSFSGARESHSNSATMMCVTNVRVIQLKMLRIDFTTFPAEKLCLYTKVKHEAHMLV